MAKKIAIKIYYDEITGEVNKVDCTKRFEEEGVLFRLEVLKESLTKKITPIDWKEEDMVAKSTVKNSDENLITH